MSGLDTEDIIFAQKALNKTLLDDPRMLSGHFWGELRVFLAVAKTGSFSRAASALATSQPTVSRQVKRLQDQMGAQLFIPTQSGVKLTAKGEQLARTLAELDQSLFLLSNDLKAESRDAAGLVRISITDGLGVFFLVPALRQFAQEHPRIQVSLQSPLNLNDLRENHTDMMIGFSPASSAEVTLRKLGTLHLVPIASRGYVERHGVPNKRNLRDHRFLQTSLYTSGNPLWEGWNNVLSQGTVAHQSDNSFAYGMMVKAGLGIGLLGNYAVMEPAALPLELGVHVPIRLHASVMTERLSARPVRLVYEWLCGLFGEANPWFSNELSLTPRPSAGDDGFRIMFNLEAGETLISDDGDR